MNRSSQMKCRAVKGFGPELLDERRIPSALADHASSCLRCQADVARYRRLRRELGALTAHTEPAPATLVGRVERAIWAEVEQARAQQHTTRMLATVAGATAAAASVVAVAMWRRARTVA